MGKERTRRIVTRMMPKVQVDVGELNNGLQDCTTSSDSSDALCNKRRKRRYDCMLNQRRYRERKRGKMHQLEEQVQALTLNTEDLESHLNILRSNILTRYVQAGTHRCNSISNYLNIFQYGLYQPHHEQYMDQMQILRGVMSESLKFNGGIGPEALLCQWKMYSSFHYLSMRVTAIRAHGPEHDVIVANNKLTLVFSRHTLARIFPHALQREDIAQRLLGREIEFDLRLSFSFDKDQVIIMNADVQMIEGLSKVLCSIEDVLFVIDGPRGEGGFLTPDGLIVPTNRLLDYVAIKDQIT